MVSQFMNIISLWISVRVDQLTAEWTIIDSKDCALNTQNTVYEDIKLLILELDMLNMLRKNRKDAEEWRTKV